MHAHTDEPLNGEKRPRWRRRVYRRAQEGSGGIISQLPKSRGTQMSVSWKLSYLTRNSNESRGPVKTRARTPGLQEPSQEAVIFRPPRSLPGGEMETPPQGACASVCVPTALHEGKRICTGPHQALVHRGPQTLQKP
ncbi:hypothetical protein CapIbe_004139 [Capra ibex]